MAIQRRWADPGSPCDVVERSLSPLVSEGCAGRDKDRIEVPGGVRTVRSALVEPSNPVSSRFPVREAIGEFLEVLA